MLTMHAELKSLMLKKFRCKYEYLSIISQIKIDCHAIANGTQFCNGWRKVNVTLSSYIEMLALLNYYKIVNNDDQICQPTYLQQDSTSRLLFGNLIQSQNGIMNPHDMVIFYPIITEYEKCNILTNIKRKFINSTDCNEYLHCPFNCQNASNPNNFVKYHPNVKEFNDKTDVTFNYQLNEQHVIKLSLYYFCKKRLSHERSKLLQNIHFCCNFINDQIIVISNKYFCQIHCMFDKHYLSCPLECILTACINKKRVEIYRESNNNNLIIAKNSQKIIISQSWHTHFSDSTTKQKLINTLTASNIDKKTLSNILQRQQRMGKIAKEIALYHRLKNIQKKHSKSNKQASKYDDRVDYLIKLYDTYTFHRYINDMALNKLSISATVRDESRKDSMQFYLVGVQTHALISLHTNFDSGSSILMTGRKDGTNRVLTRLSDGITIVDAITKKYVICHTNFLSIEFQNQLDNTDLGLCSRLNIGTKPNCEPNAYATVFGHWVSIHRRNHWIYDKNDKLTGIMSNDNKYYLPIKYFDCRYRNLKCDFCNKRRNQPKMRVCKSCKSVKYCNRQCQKRGWLAGHKQRCPSLKTAYQRFQAHGSRS